MLTTKKNSFFSLLSLSLGLTIFAAEPTFASSHQDRPLALPELRLSPDSSGEEDKKTVKDKEEPKKDNSAPEQNEQPAPSLVRSVTGPIEAGTQPQSAKPQTRNTSRQTSSQTFLSQRPVAEERQLPQSLSLIESLAAPRPKAPQLASTDEEAPTSGRSLAPTAYAGATGFDADNYLYGAGILGMLGAGLIASSVLKNRNKRI